MKDSLTELSWDLEDLALRARDLGLTELARDLEQRALRLRKDQTNEVRTDAAGGSIRDVG